MGNECGPPEPSGEACESGHVFEWEGRQCKALWYPQMGGYVGRAVAVRCGPIEGHSCFDVYVWHDGDFPFGEGDDDDRPRLIHHCEARQFIEFGRQLQRFEDSGR